MIFDTLNSEIKKRGPVCVGLDTRLDYLPKCITERDISLGEKLFEFNRAIVDATREHAACFKLQIACYEAHGLEGLSAFARSVRYIRELGVPVITDAKRGDIASTAEMYAKAHFEGELETDMLTVNAYMGEDAVSPYYPYLSKNKGVFVLIKTSNPSSGDIEDADCGGEPLYVRMARLAAKWGAPFIGESGFSSVGAVVGCTFPGEFAAVRAVMPNGFFLIPGYGAQGGTGEDIAEFFRGGVCGVVNSSRGIIAAHKGKTENGDFADYARRAALDMKGDILKWL